MARNQKEQTVDVAFKLEYVTSAMSLQKGDGIVVHVVNDSGIAENTQAIIYHNTGAGARTAADSGVVAVAPTWNWGLGFTIPESGEYWLRIQAASEFLIPKAAFERVQGGLWIPIVTYRPGDFAAFSLGRRRLW